MGLLEMPCLCVWGLRLEWMPCCGDSWWAIFKVRENQFLPRQRFESGHKPTLAGIATEMSRTSVPSPPGLVLQPGRVPSCHMGSWPTYSESLTSGPRDKHKGPTLIPVISPLKSAQMPPESKAGDWISSVHLVRQGSCWSSWVWALVSVYTLT